MNIGEKINSLRKRNNLSQDTFAELFHVTRQTVSNWENGKSYPDLETILKISDKFQISIDELLKDNLEVVKKIDSEKKKKNTLLAAIGILVFAAVISAIWVYKKYEANNAVSFDMSQSKTYQAQETSQSSLDVGTGYFTLPKNGKVSIETEAETDDGELHIRITDDKNEKNYYQIDGQSIDDSQTLYFDEGSYKIQITANGYTEEVVSLSYHVKVNNRK